MSRNPIGVLLRNRRAGQHLLAWADPALTPAAPGTLTLTSPAFAHGATMPERYKGRLRGPNISPALTWTPPRTTTAELVLVVQDPDVPFGKPAVHALARITDPSVRELPDDALSPRVDTPGLLLGAGVMGRREYAGPMPVRSHGPHAYVFQLFAVDTRLDFPERFTLSETIAAMSGHVVDRARLDGMFEAV
jgi:Raf kinase inhibitor-like YbhB/YbcL family protein